MNSVKKILKSTLIGIGSIIPGISGSMLATILNIYEELVIALNRFLKEPFKAMFSVWEYILGIIIGLFIGFFIVSYFFTISPLPITLLFIGFILGTVPSLYKETTRSRLNYKQIIVFIITLIIMLLLMLVQGKDNQKASYVYVLIIGILTSIALIIPGLSSATLLLILGFYQTLLDIINGIISSIIPFNKAVLFTELPVFIVLIVGIIIGLILMGKVMQYLLNKKKIYFSTAVFAIAIFSPLNIMFVLNKEYTFNYEWYYVLLGIILLIIGFIVSKNIIGEKGEKND